MSPIEERRATFRADCGSCFALCCSALGFARSAEFAFDKPAGEPCVNLRDEDFGCRIHPTLRASGFTGCTVFDCGGAGQKVAQQVFGGVSWREAPETREQMFAVFRVVRQLQELLWYLSEALELGVGELRAEIAALYDEVDRATTASPDAIAALDPAAHQARASELLLRVSDRVRAEARRENALSAPARRLRRGADLIGADLRRLDLRAADLRGAYLIGADLRRADLGWCDLLGADLRDADIRGADLSTALFVTQAQVNAARGDSGTRIPPALLRPDQWVD